MRNNRQEIPFPEELERLEQITGLLTEAWKESCKSADRSEMDYKESKKYMAEYRHEIDPREIFQNEQQLKSIEHSGMIAVRERDRLAKLLGSPYFSRIDFCLEGEEKADIYYIGRFTFSRSKEILIFDWRAPIASMFYEYDTGPAGYQAPIGRIEGEITRKRQFEIVDGEMKYALESAVNIHDDILKRELSSTSDEKMKTILTTLQREQNAVIRNEHTAVMVIQGVAGSGKTSIALHRIAYLLYRFKDTLAAENIVILSPNKVFGDYISNVLPELGEEPIFEMSFADIAEVQLEGVISFETQMMETEAEWTERSRFKSTFEFISSLKQYLNRMEEYIFQADDYAFESFVVKAEWIQERYQAYSRYPVKKRLDEVADDIYEKIVSENIREAELPRLRSIIKQLNIMLKIKESLDLYRGFYQDIGQTEFFVEASNGKLEWTDVYPFMYVHFYYEGFKENRMIKHLVVDEMQDYSPVQYEVLNLLFRCNKTILGDFGQAVYSYNQNSLEIMEQMYPEAEVVRLNKSYRSSYEIITFAKRILDDDALEPVERHGEEPEVVSCAGTEEEIQQIRNKIDAFLVSDYVTMGIAAKNNEDAKVLYQMLRDEYEISLLTPESDKFINGVIVTSIQMAKGLEFDEVIIVSADKETYYSDHDRKLLYIACTRAMHKLSLICSGEPTELTGN